MFTINLHNLHFFAFHGVHPEEKILGNTFIVDVQISLPGEEPVTKLEQTVDYVTVYEIIKKRMLEPAALLEILVQDLAQKISTLDERIRSISITITKKDPPIPNMEGSVSVNYKKDF